MEATKDFLAPKLQGERFKSHTIPLSLLEDFSALEELIFDLAKQIYLDENPNRRRVPKGFTDDVRLSISEITEGSAIPKFVLIFATVSASILGDAYPISTSYVEKAKDKIIDAIDRANQNKSINLDQKSLNYFNRIGKNLLDDESIDFLPNSEKKAVLNKDIRRTILLSRSEKHEYSSSITFNASIPSVDKGDGTFKLNIDGNVIECSLDIAGEYYKTILSAFFEYENNTLVSIKATGIFNEQDKLIRLEGMEAMDVLDPFDVNIRLNYLSKLKDNWYDGFGKAPNHNYLNRFGEYFSLYFNQGLPLPAIFPTVEGNIQLEWSTNKANVVLDVALGKFTAELLISNSDDTFEELEVNLTNQNGWEIINNKIEQSINE